MYVQRLEIQNFRCFDQTELELNYPGRVANEDRSVPSRLDNVNLFLGDNGSGKSSVLRSLVLAVLMPILSNSGFQAEYLVRRQGEGNSQSASNGISAPIGSMLTAIFADMKLNQYDINGIPESGTERAIANITLVGDYETIFFTHNAYQTFPNLFLDDSIAFFLTGYGANRRIERPEGYSESTRKPRYQRVAGLFEEHVGLVPFSYAYLQLKDRDYFTEAHAILNALLPDEISLTDRVDGQNRPLFENDQVLLPFNALSDGFRAYIGWIWDLLYQMSMLKVPDGSRLALLEIPGIVIVDEIDLFLHPEWQRRVIEQIATTFPKLQFLFSSHSPLVAGTLEPENIFVLENNKVEQYRENIFGLTPNQILTSSYFGLRSTRAPRTGTLSDLAKRQLGQANTATATEEADPRDLSLDPKERARKMLEEIGDE